MTEQKRSPLDGRNLFALIPYITGPLVDNALVGTWRYCMARATNALANTDTDFTHQLGRVPNGIFPVRTAKGGVLYDASNGTASWTATNIRLRSTVAADTVSFFVF